MALDSGSTPVFILSALPDILHRVRSRLFTEQHVESPSLNRFVQLLGEESLGHSVERDRYPQCTLINQFSLMHFVPTRTLIQMYADSLDIEYSELRGVHIDFVALQTEYRTLTGQELSFNASVTPLVVSKTKVRLSEFKTTDGHLLEFTKWTDAGYMVQLGHKMQARFKSSKPEEERLALKCLAIILYGIENVKFQLSVEDRHADGFIPGLGEIQIVKILPDMYEFLAQDGQYNDTVSVEQLFKSLGQSVNRKAKKYSDDTKHNLTLLLDGSFSGLQLEAIEEFGHTMANLLAASLFKNVYYVDSLRGFGVRLFSPGKPIESFSVLLPERLASGYAAADITVASSTHSTKVYLCSQTEIHEICSRTLNSNSSSGRVHLPPPDFVSRLWNDIETVSEVTEGADPLE